MTNNNDKGETKFRKQLTDVMDQIKNDLIDNNPAMSYGFIGPFSKGRQK